MSENTNPAIAASNQPINDVFVVVRGIGERTEKAVMALSKEAVGDSNVMLVSDAPFSATLKKSFQVAIERGLPWTFCVDADVLLIPDVIRHFRRAVQGAPRKLIGIHGTVLDKLFGGIRPAGTRIYQTELLKTAINFIPEGEKSNRPETFARKAMQRAGYDWMTHGILSGLHDAEQYYRDIYRTSFFHAQKHRKFVPILKPYWERMSSHDSDFKVALRGVEDGSREEKVLGLDVRNFTERTQQVLDELGLEEKPEMQVDVHQLNSFIEKTIMNWETPPEYDLFWKQTREPSRAARLLGPTLLKKLGLNSLPEE